MTHQTWSPATSGADASIDRSQRARLRHERLELVTCTPSRVSTLEIVIRDCTDVHSMRESGMTRSA